MDVRMDVAKRIADLEERMARYEGAAQALERTQQAITATLGELHEALSALRAAVEDLSRLAAAKMAAPHGDIRRKLADGPPH